MARNYSFRFYGRKPDDWVEGANLGHGFGVQFAREPTEAEARALGELYERTLATGPAEPSPDPWRWSGRFAGFDVGERWSSGRAFLGAVTDFLMEAKHIVPLKDVVYMNAREGAGAWDRWSLSQGPPDPGPDLGTAFMVEYRRPIDPAAAPLRANAAFEEGRGAWREAAAARRRARDIEAADALTVPRKPGNVGLVRTDASFEPRPPPSWAGPDLDGFHRPDPPVVAREAYGKSYTVRAAGDHVIDECEARPIAWVVDDDGTQVDVAWLDDGQRRGPRWPDGAPPPHLRHARLDPSGSQLLLLFASSAHLVDLSTGSARCIYIRKPEDGDYLGDIDFADGGRAWAILGLRRFRILRPREGAVEAVADVKSGGLMLLASREGRFFVLGPHKPRAFAFVEGKLKSVGRFNVQFRHMLEREGRLLLQLNDDAAYEVTDVDATLVAKSRAKPRKSRASRPKLTLAPADATPPGFLSEADEIEAKKTAVAEGLPGASWFHVQVAPDGRVVSLADSVGTFSSAFKQLVWSEAGTRASTRLPGPRTMVHLAVGTSVFVTSPPAVYRVDLVARAPREFFELPAEAGPMQAIACLGDVVFVLGQKQLYCVSSSGETAAVLGSIKVTRPRQLFTLPEHGIAIVLGDAKAKAVVYDVHNGKLRKLGQFSQPVGRPQAVDGRVLVVDDLGGVWELQGLPGVRERRSIGS